jgi:hypothetical protein
MGFFSSIGKAFKAVANVATKVVSVANKVLNSPLGKLAQMIPGVGPFIAGAAKVTAMADGAIQGFKKGGIGGALKGIAGGLIESFGGKLGGLLGKAGSFLSKTGLDTVIGLGSKAQNSNQLLDFVSTLMGPRQGNQTDAAQGDRYNMQQFAAYQLAQLLQPR